MILEYQSPSTAIVNAADAAHRPRCQLDVSSMVLACFIAMAVIKVDQVVTAQGVVIARAPTIVVQPLETSIVRSIDVHRGEAVHAGQLLARLDPTFAAADLEALKSQVADYSAQVARMQAEVENRPFNYSGSDPHLALQAAIYAQRQSEYNFKLENYRQKADSLSARSRPRRAISRLPGPSGYGERVGKDAQGPGSARRRQQAQHLVGAGHTGRDAAQPGRIGPGG